MISKKKQELLEVKLRRMIQSELKNSKPLEESKNYDAYLNRARPLFEDMQDLQFELASLAETFKDKNDLAIWEKVQDMLVNLSYHGDL